MTISAISSNAYWVTNSVKNDLKQPGTATFSGKRSASSASPAAREAATDLANSAGQNIPMSSALSGASNAVLLAFQEMNSSSRPEGLTDSQWLTQLTAHLGASDYIYAKLALRDQQAEKQLASGEAGDTIKVNFQNHTFTVMGKVMQASSLKPVESLSS
ncbi:hypothetical protein [Emcibacter sp.]|uniref:hypothetical protein n=1 Tax=Emcibacter sp. TaxID=1979954 RepID=UPI003A9528C9